MKNIWLYFSWRL